MENTKEILSLTSSQFCATTTPLISREFWFPLGRGKKVNQLPTKEYLEKGLAVLTAAHHVTLHSKLH